MIKGLILYKDIIIEPLYLSTNVFHRINGRKVSILGLCLLPQNQHIGRVHR